MKAKPTLYEMLGVPPGSGVAELQAAFRREMNGLEARRAGMGAEEFTDRAQLLRLAYSTLSDPVSRNGYDAKLEANARALPAAAVGRALALPDSRGAAGAGPSAEVRADALSLRADALALRADAMLARAGIDVALERHGGIGASLASGAMTGVKRFVRAIGLLVVIAAVAFFAARCTLGDPAARRAAAEAKAAEAAALQEYFQAHGVRPANMAELERLEADRRRQANEERQAEQDRRKQELDARRFEEDARRRAQEVSAELQRAEQQQRYQEQRERELQLREQQLRLAREEAERRRAEAQQQQWRNTLSR